MKFAKYMGIISILFFVGCSRGSNRKWHNIDKSFRNIQFAKKGNNDANGYSLIEERTKQENKIDVLKYQLINPSGIRKTLILEAKLGTRELIYFDFTDKYLFVILNSFAQRDWISVKSFDIDTGEIVFQGGGEIPCIKESNYDWNLGNSNCSWINIGDKNVSYLTQSQSESKQIGYNTISYNWKNNRIDTIEIKKNMGVLANGGLGIETNIKYDHRKKKFKLK